MGTSISLTKYSLMFSLGDKRHLNVLYFFIFIQIIEIIYFRFFYSMSPKMYGWVMRCIIHFEITFPVITYICLTHQF